MSTACSIAKGSQAPFGGRADPGPVRRRCETLNVLVQERLIRRERRLESTFYEISHDRLAESIYASRRNKLPKKEQEQRQKDREQLEKEQELRKKQQQLIGTLKRYVAGVSVLCGVLAIVLGTAALFYFDAKASRRMVETEKELRS